MTKINISIPQPCHENWEAMTAVDKGKFCASCQKKVFDFTTSSDSEIINAFQQNQNLCGRFLNTQLNRDLIKPEKKNTLWLATTTALISLVGLNEATAQEPVKTEQTDIKMVGKFVTNIPKAENPEIEISGVVIDDSDSRKFPLPGANISVKGTNIKTQTDFDGKFSIRAHRNEILVFQYVGMETKEIIVNDKILIIKLKENQHLQGEIIIRKKRSFFGRLFHKSKYRYN